MTSYVERLRSLVDVSGLPDADVVRDRTYWNQYAKTRCPHEQIQMMLLHQRDGRSVVVEVCRACSCKIKTVPKREWPGDWESLTTYRDNRCDLCLGNGCAMCAIPCHKCGSYAGTELHHWAPRHLFDDADDWPQSFL